MQQPPHRASAGGIGNRPAKDRASRAIGGSESGATVLRGLGD
jgi:hypothetical protein